MSTKIFIENQKLLCSSTRVENGTEDKVITLRMPDDLIEQLEQIKRETSRSRSKVIILLLKRGIDAYRSDGVLLDTRITQAPNGTEFSEGHPEAPRQSYLFSEGIGNKKKTNRESRAIRKDIEDMKRDARERTDRKLKGQK